VIVPADRRVLFWKDVADEFLDKDTLHKGIERLKQTHVGLVVLSNKYDGIDLPYDACRLLVLDGLPEVRRYVDRYEQSVLNEGDEILSRQMQRIEQGMGRGVRANDDYCVVMIMGSKLTQALFSTDVSDKFSPATAAQMRLSDNLAKQIRGKPITELHAIVALCLERNPGWVRASKQALVNVTYDDRAKSWMRPLFNVRRLVLPSAISSVKRPTPFKDLLIRRQVQKFKAGSNSNSPNTCIITISRRHKKFYFQRP
jgi:hypothetical protein